MSIFSKLKSSKNSGPQPPIDFQAAFDNVSDSIKTKVKSLGKLNVHTGSIVACDGIVYNDAKPFAQKVSPGFYEVSVLISDRGSGDKPNERYALARLAITDKPAVSWKLATTDSQKLGDLKPGEIFGYPVDAGVGSFMDEKTHKEFDAFATKLYENDPAADIYDDYLAELFKKNAEKPDDPQDYGDWVNVVVPGTVQDNVIIFHSGWGDGFYATYWGYDSDDNICCLVTDFQVLGETE